MKTILNACLFWYDITGSPLLCISWCRDDFTAYADVCFREFGDRVAHWTTILEPNIIAQGSYDKGIAAPGHCSYPFGRDCTVGNSSVEPYLYLHYSLLAHSSVVGLYREKYQVGLFIPFRFRAFCFCWIFLISHTNMILSLNLRLQVVQKGVVGINLYSLCIYALTDSAEDIQATERANDFLFGRYVMQCLFMQFVKYYCKTWYTICRAQ